MKKEFLQSSARAAIRRELKNNTPIDEIKSFANDVLSTCAEHADKIPGSALEKLRKNHPALTTEITAALKKETEAAEESAMEEMRKKITS